MWESSLPLARFLKRLWDGWETCLRFSTRSIAQSFPSDSHESAHGPKAAAPCALAYTDRPTECATPVEGLAPSAGSSRQPLAGGIWHEKARYEQLDRALGCIGTQMDGCG